MVHSVNRLCKHCSHFHKGPVDHFGSLAPKTAPFWQFMAPETKENLFGNLWVQKSPYSGSLWPQKLHHSGDFWFRILGPEIAKLVQFLGPETAGIWLFLDLFRKYLFSFPPGPRQYLKVFVFCFSIVIFKVFIM